MSRPRARPRFTMELPAPPEAVAARLRAHLAGHRALRGTVLQRTALLTVRREDAHFWSPHLDVQLAETDAGGTRLAAMFAPHPSVWASFLAAQLLFALLVLGAGVWLLTMLSMGGEPWPALAALVGAAAGGGLAYGAAYVGQGIGSEQMYELRAFVDEALRPLGEQGASGAAA